MTIHVHHGDCLDVLRTLPDASVDAVVTDPPAGIAFMGKAWDGAKGGREQWSAWLAEVMAEAYRVAKPGAHALVWALPRTSHWTACGLEDAGWEIRDRLVHLFGTGFPKSLDVSKAIDNAAGAEREVTATEQNWGRSRLADGKTAFGNYAGEWQITAPATDAAATWQGWGTALKPAAEDWWLARKPLQGMVAANVLAHGTGGLNIDGCRMDSSDETLTHTLGGGGMFRLDGFSTLAELEAAAARGDQPPTGRDARATLARFRKYADAERTEPIGRWPANVTLDEDAARMLDEQSGETSGASRFFYVAKAKTSERVRLDGTAHPTVKPLALMRWLTRLITPPGGVVLDMFAGSGTTAEACLLEGFRCIAIEREADYLPLIRQRINRRSDPVAAVRATTDDAGLFDLLDGEPA